MATLHVTEFVGQGESQNRYNGEMSAAKVPGTANNNVTYTTSAQSSAFNAGTNLVRIMTEVDVYIAFGSNPTATTSDIKMLADTAEYFAVSPGDKVAAYDGTS